MRTVAVHQHGEGFTVTSNHLKSVVKTHRRKAIETPVNHQRRETPENAGSGQKLVKKAHISEAWVGVIKK